MWGIDILADCDEFPTDLLLDDSVWDVFELDDETAEPEPEYGDFWWQPRDDDRICGFYASMAELAGNSSNRKDMRDDCRDSCE